MSDVEVFSQPKVLRQSSLPTETEVPGRRELAELLRASESRIRLTADAGALGLWTWDPIADCVEPENDRAYEIFGVPPSHDAINASCLVREYLHEDDVDAFERAASATLETGKPFFFQGRIYRQPDRELRWVELNGRLQPAANGRAGHIIGTTADITARKQAEQRERQAVAAALAAAEASAKFRTFFEQGAGFAGVLSLDGTVIEVNRYSLEASGFSRDEIVGQKFWDCAWWARSERLVALVRHAVAQAIEGKLYRIETPYFVADGSERIVEMTIAPVTDDSGQVLFVAPTGIDVTDRARSEEELQRMAADLATANRNKTEFLAVLAHELRNPLAPIRNGLEILRVAGGSSSIANQAGEMMTRQIAHLVRLIDDLLDIARINSGKVTLKRCDVELGSIVNAALETTLPAIEAAGHELTVQLHDPSAILHADIGRLSQVVANLLNNAAKYTPPRGHIELSAHVEGDQAVITVSDNGVGIAPEQLAEIFGLFHQESRNRDRADGGLGVGLSLVKRLVELHDGIVTAESEGPGKGSKFRVCLPLAAQSSQSLLPELEDIEQPRASGLRVLITDDNVDAAISLALLVQLQGHTAEVAHDGFRALDIAASFKPDVMFLDIGMPGMSGYDVAREMRRTPGLEHVPCIALTGWGADTDRARSRQAGFYRHLTKPVELHEVEQVLSELSHAPERVASSRHH